MPQLAGNRLPQPSPDPPAPAPSGDRRPRVLLVEDDPLQRLGLLRLLDVHGITAHHVDTAEAGLHAVATQEPYDVIVSDLALGRLSGADRARRLRQPLLIAYSGYDTLPPWFDAGLVKPAVGALLQTFGARRLSIVLTETVEGGYLARCHETDTRCYGRSPPEVLQMLARALPALPQPAGAPRT